MKTSRLLAISTIFVWLLAPVANLQAAPKEAPPGRIPGHYIVVLKDGADVTTAADDMVRKHGLGVEQVYEHALKGFAGTIPDGKLAELARDPRVAFVSEDREVVMYGKPSSGGVAQPPQVLPKGVDRINAELATHGASGVNVAVIDTGIDLTHPDLRNIIAGGKNCSTGGSYADGNGHGTHVAGTIAAQNNAIGVVGVAPGARLWSVRVLNNSGSGSWSSIICGIDFVTAHAPAYGGPITVANMSLGGPGTSDNNCGNTNNDALHKALCRSRDAGVTYVVAAGNEAANANLSVPAAYDDAVITVSALADTDGAGGGVGAATSYGADDTFASFSNFGPAVDIAAPGVSIFSTYKGGGYATLSGTSMATPHVAGAAALYIATHPGASWTTVRDALVSSGEPLGAGHTDPSGLHPEPVLQASGL